jgi:REP element-mobilizing transposase RayT
MASTYLALHCHFIFSTKDRFPFIERIWRDRLHAYMGGILQEMGVTPESIGGMADHVHLLAGLRATYTIADVVHDIKRGSSVWIHDELNHLKSAWQTAVMVIPSQLEAVKRYIETQEEQHRRQSFQNEYRKLLEKAGIEYDEKYLWG